MWPRTSFKRLVRFLAFMMTFLALGACEPHAAVQSSGDAIAKGLPMIEIKSSAFKAGDPIPVLYTEDGKNVSPPLDWSPAPEGTKRWAIICDDPDAPRATPWVHWVIYDLPAETDSLREAIAPKPLLDRPKGARQGRNSWATVGYRGPAPPKGSGPHHYHFKIYAIDAAIKLEAGLDKASLLEKIRDHVIAEGDLVGTYQR